MPDIHALVADIRSSDKDVQNHAFETLVRSDIIESLKRVHDATGDDTISTTAEQLIATEEDDKYRGKYARVWSSRAGS